MSFHGSRPRLSALQLPALTRSTWSHGCSPTLGFQPCNRASCLKTSIWWCQSERLSYHTLKELIQVSIVCSYHMLNLVYIFLPISQGLSPLSLFQNAQLLPSEKVSSLWGFPPAPKPSYLDVPCLLSGIQSAKKQQLFFHKIIPASGTVPGPQQALRRHLKWTDGHTSSSLSNEDTILVSYDF